MLFVRASQSNRGISAAGIAESRACVAARPERAHTRTPCPFMPGCPATFGDWYTFGKGLRHIHPPHHPASVHHGRPGAFARIETPSRPSRRSVTAVTTSGSAASASPAGPPWCRAAGSTRSCRETRGLWGRSAAQRRRTSATCLPAAARVGQPRDEHHVRERESIMWRIRELETTRVSVP